MRKGAIIIILIVLVCLVSGQAGDYKYSIGISGGYLKLTGGDFFTFDPDISYGFNLGHRLGDRWFFNVDYTYYKLTNDITVDSTATVAAITNNAPIDYKTTRLGVTLNRLVFSHHRRLNIN